MNKEDTEQFVYRVSHDLKEPLTTIVSYAQLLKELYKNQLDADANKFIDTILLSADQLNKRIAGLTALSRVGRAQQIEEADCSKLLAEALNELEPEIQKSGASVEFEKLPVVKGFPAELKRLFKELIQNAINFRKEDVGLKIAISARKVSGATEFLVRDNAIGIDLTKQDKIFNPFFKLNPGNVGDGIGLAICKRIAQLHGGDLHVQSIKDEGSTFTFTVSDHLS